MASPAAAERRRVRYGGDPRQYVDLTGAPDGGCVLFVHGGFWRAEKDSESLWPAVVATAAAAGCAGTVEFRTADAGGAWPLCHEDVVDAVRAVWEAEGVAPERTVLVGHSAGGHLALTAAADLTGLGAVVGLSAVTDLVAAAAEGLGDGAVSVLFGGRADVGDAELREASPLHRPRPRCAVELLHAGEDQAVPVSYSRRLSERWGTVAPVPSTVVEGARHMHLVNPERAAWATVSARLADLTRALVPAGGAT